MADYRRDLFSREFSYRYRVVSRLNWVSHPSTAERVCLVWVGIPVAVVSGEVVVVSDFPVAALAVAALVVSRILFQCLSMA